VMDEDHEQRRLLQSAKTCVCKLSTHAPIFKILLVVFEATLFQLSKQCRHNQAASIITQRPLAWNVIWLGYW